jgi:PhzF family phenazine biosynthesis protein
LKGGGLKGGDLIWLLMPTPSFSKPPSGIEQLLGIMDLTPEVLDDHMEPVFTQDGDLIVFVRDFMSLQSARPEFAALRQHCERRRIRGVCLSTTNTLNADTHAQSRFFAPTSGVNEDPVTGSVHGPLAAYLVRMGRVSIVDGMATINCVQSVAGGRAGMVRAVVGTNIAEEYEVAIAGRCITTMAGQLFLE